MSNIIDSIQLSGVTYTLQGSGGGTVSSAITSGDTNAVAGGAVYDKFDEVEQVTARALNDLDEKINPTVELTQAEYDALVSAGTVSADTYYIITDATPIETSGFVQTSAITSSVTSASTDSEIPTAKAVWEAASGGGTTYTAGRGIDITNDTISVSLPISAGTGSNSIAEGQNTTASGQYGSHAEGYYTTASGDSSHAEGLDTQANGFNSHAEGYSTKANGESSHAEGFDATASGDSSHAEGSSTRANGNYSHAEGQYTTASGESSHAEGTGTRANGHSSHAEGINTKANNKSEHASGQFNVSSSASTTFGDSGNTLFSVGNGTANNARHNAFEIRQNGDIYLSLNGQDVKLQDQLGGSSITVDTALDSGSTNPVENRVIYNKIDEIEQVTARALNELNEEVSEKQDTLVSGTNIKTINNTSILGSGNIDIQGGGGTVESAITSGSTNAVESKAIWSATTYNKNVLLTFNGNKQSTNYPNGCGKIKVEIDKSFQGINYISFRNNEHIQIGSIQIQYFSNEIAVDTDSFTSASYEISGTTVVINYPSTDITYVETVITRWTYTAVVEGAWIADNTYMKSEVDAIASGLQNNINSKLDATAYTPTVVDSALNVASTNPIQNQALYHELRFVNGETETTLAFENKYSTNYPIGCTKLIVEVVGSNNNSIIHFCGSDDQSLGYIRISYYGSITVDTDSFTSASYEISGTTVIITYPTVTNVTKIMVHNGDYVCKAIVANVTPLIDQVAANTTALSSVETRLTEDEEVTAAGLNALNDAFGGLKLVKLTQAEYNALATKDSSTLYIIVN